jgi:branched-chain amino acid aminotransferase
MSSGHNAFPATEWVWADGKAVRWQDATIHVMSHVVHYGSSVFEGMRAYGTRQGPMYFRYAEHMKRLRESAAIHRMTYPHADDQLRDAISDLIDRNGLENGAYIRPIVFRGIGSAGIDPSGSPVHVFVVTWEWGAYLGAKAMEEGINAGVSSWFRPAPNTHPTMAKAGGNYINSALMKLQAKQDGYDEAIALSVDGLVSEGSGQNLFVVRNAELLTPAIDATFLQGITRDSVMAIARDLGIPVREARIPREALYVADEIFLCGTATEVTPVRSVDRVQIGAGRRGPITQQIQERYIAIARGEHPDRHGWLSPASLKSEAARSVAKGAPKQAKVGA